MQDHYTDHLQLLEAWKDEVHAMKKKHAADSDDDDDKKKPDHVKISPSIDEKEVGLRLKNKKTGLESTVDDVSDNEVVLSGPEGDEKKMSKANVASLYELD